MSRCAVRGMDVRDALVSGYVSNEDCAGTYRASSCFVRAVLPILSLGWSRSAKQCTLPRCHRIAPAKMSLEGEPSSNCSVG